ncbi:hypothetical protein As57867_008029, partial [Aphanomyces stellatus]
MPVVGEGFLMRCEIVEWDDHPQRLCSAKAFCPLGLGTNIEMHQTFDFECVVNGTSVARFAPIHFFALPLQEIPPTRQENQREMSFCERFDIVGDPVYVSSTSVVVKALDRCIARRMFGATCDGFFLKHMFNECMEILGPMATKESFDFSSSSDLFRTLKLYSFGTREVTWSAFERFCNKECGDFQVAIKFMRSRESFQRELDNRAAVDSAYVVPTLPCDEHAIARHVSTLTLAGVDDMSEYKYAIVMPYARLHLADLIQTATA